MGLPWSQWETCDDKDEHYATAYQTKTEEDQTLFGDDTALNGIRLICSNGKQYLHILKIPLHICNVVIKCIPYTFRFNLHTL